MRFCSWIASLLLSLTVYSQNVHYNFFKLDTHNGLSHNQVNSILKDTDGFLWIGTLSGLNRYDGYSCKIYTKRYNDSTSLFDNSVRTLFELPGGRIWVDTRNGPCIYDPRTERFDANSNGFLNALGLPSGTITDIVKGNDGRYWFLYENQEMYLYTGKDKMAKPFGKDLPSVPPEKIAAVTETKDGMLWLVYQDGLLQKYDIRNNRIVLTAAAVQQKLKGKMPHKLFVDDEGDCWLYQYSYGVLLFHPAGNSITQFNQNAAQLKLGSNLVSRIVQDNNGLIWVAADQGGVTLIDKKNGLKTSYLLNDPKDPQSLSHNSINSMYKDDNGIIWLGTYKQGVNYFNGNIVQFPLYHHQESNAGSLQFNDVNRFVEDKRGNIWIGTNGGGLICFNRKTNSFTQYLHRPEDPNSLSNNVIVSLWIDHEDKLWIGTYFGGLNCFDGKKFIRYTHDDKDTSSLADDKIWEILEDRNDNLWIGTLGGGLDLFDRKTNRFRHFKFQEGKNIPVTANFISALLEDRKGNLWIGTVSGIVVFEKGATHPALYQQTNKKGGLSNDNVLCFLEDSQGRIWAGTREGLNLYNEQTKNFRVFTTADGLPDNMILNILEDDHHRFWISTPNGLCNITPRQEGNNMVFSVINYDENNNLQNREFNENAALKTRSGELIFGGPSGFNIIDPSSIRQPAYRSGIVFTGLQLLNKPIHPGEQVNGRVLLEQALSQTGSIHLKYSENVFSIDFTTLDFDNNSRKKFAYLMEGFNADWLYADGNQRRATFTNLGPGSYTFKVKAMNRDGSWGNAKTLGIIIEPPFWRTTLAWFIYAFAALGIFLLVRRITLDRMHMRFELQQQRREAERAHGLEQLKTKFFTNVSHEFRTPLSLIIAPLKKILDNSQDDELKKQLSLVQRNAKRLLNLVNQLLDFRKMEVQEIRLHPSIGDIVRFCREISLSFTDIAEKKHIQFSFSSAIDELEIWFDRDKMEKILFNLLSNAFKYTHDNGMVSIGLTYKPPVQDGADGTLAIEVKDTGIGIPEGMQERIFERFFQTDVPDSMVNQGTGIGLAITKEFVKLHNGIITVQSEREKGACFTVLLPARKIFELATKTTVNPLPVEEDEQLILEETQKSGKKKTILIVEDNEDLRFYLKDNLKLQYHVEEATNGREGWEKIKILNPDLVVSDIMMPLMDGLELARKIKTETLTAHIPVILLTAMGSEEKQLEGLKIGVNDYITKPFTFEILASRIRNLLAQQKLLQKRFQKQIEVNPAEVTITSVDEKFLQQALQVVEKKMDDPEFSVEDFSRDMYMSRVTLYRKILSLTGKSPIEFIRSIRLKRAAQILEKSGMLVAEVAYEVGFNNPKHFAKFFKEEFKVTPSQYIAERKNKNE